MGKQKKNITVTIDAIECKALYGQTILQIARANDIYIPTMCYLTKVEPIASCRMCVVDVEGVDGMILSCQAKATDGAVIHTSNANIERERTNIIKLYDVNHPLECGVCDKSGECDLQNKTLEFGVNEQPFAAKDEHRPVQNWGFVSYDPSLCIMCEKCVKVSNEITGNEALQISAGGYHSTIVNTKNDKLDMTLGESAAVCPVGALVSTDFKYSTNAWELEKIPATCSHCSGGCKIYYEIKNDKIYRVTNDYEFSSICGLGRYSFDFANTNVTKDEKLFAKVIDNFKEAESIIFDSKITNEEAFILQKLKEKYGYRLISHEARAYQRFMRAFSSISGKKLYSGDLQNIAKSRAIISIGTKVLDDSHQALYHMTMAAKRNRAQVIYMHPMEDKDLQSIVTQFVKYEAQSEEGVVALLADALLTGIELPESVRAILDDLDIGNLSAESNVGEEELEDIRVSLAGKGEISLIVGADIYSHPRVENIAKILAVLERYANVSVLAIPTSTNTLGVSLICDLDDNTVGKTIGYNAKADCTIGSIDGVDMDMPALNQQEGTFTTMDKRLVPTNVALPYGGYVLNDIANALGVLSPHTIDYTHRLPKKMGFKGIKFDYLDNHYDTMGRDCRGYLLENMTCESDVSIEEIEELDGYDGVIVYNYDISTEIAKRVRDDRDSQSEINLLGSQQFASASKLSDGDKINFELNGVNFDRVFRIDTSMKGTIAINPTFDAGLSRALLSSYRFSRLKFQRVES